MLAYSIDACTLNCVTNWEYCRQNWLYSQNFSGINIFLYLVFKLCSCLFLINISSRQLKVNLLRYSFNLQEVYSTYVHSANWSSTKQDSGRPGPYSYRQCRPAPVSKNRTLAEQDLRRVCWINTKVWFSYMLMQSYNMLSIENVAV